VTHLLTAALLALMLPACTLCHRPPTSADLTKHPVKQLAFWGAQLDKPLEQRVGAASDDVVAYLRLDNEVNAYTARPETTAMPAALEDDVRAILAALPPRFRELLGAKLLGVFAAQGLGSSAYTDFVRDAQGAPVAAFVVIDAQAMTRAANDWIAWKESTPFKPEPGWAIEGELEPPASNTTRGALEFVLIHELGHVLAFDEDVHPLWSVTPSLVDPEDYPFFDVAWTVKDGAYFRKVERTDPAPGPITYYKERDDRPAASRLPEFYDWLAKTDFVTLYAATNPFDDFAESIVTYLHTVVMKKPYKLTITHDGTPVRTWTPCWEEPRCAAKRRELEAFLKLSPAN
jgi:hypothetical protein